MTTTTTTTAAVAPDTGTPESPLDLLCVGIGPFGLGLACLADPLEDVRAAFLDRRPEFDWHPGLLFEDATLQVPFLADLVTMADPTSSYSFLNWLKTTGRLYSFYVRESFYPLRRDYNAYCRWAAARLPGLHWGHDVVSVRRPEGSGAWQVTSAGPQGETTWWTRHLVVGAGTAAVLPEVLSGAGAAAVHASQYLHERDRLVARDHVTVLGSGQSAAEVVLDLLEAPQAPAVDWITRSPRFYPMEYTELTLELTSPEYLDHFRCLPEDRRDELNRSQPQLHRGISAETISRIYETLIVRRAAGDRAPVRLLAATELTDAQPHDGRTLLSWRSTESGQRRETLTDAVIAGTGYLPAPLPWLEPVLSQLSLDAAGRLTPDRWHRASTDGSLHVLNHTEHTHALTAPDLGMGPMRAAIVLDHVTGRRPYPVERRTMFQSFGQLPQTSWGPRPETLAGPFTTTLQDGRRFSIRSVRPEADRELLHGWLTEPRAEAWGLVGASPEAVGRVQREIADSGAAAAWIVEELIGADGTRTPRAMLETYDPARSPLAGIFTVRDGDAGLHFFMAPAEDPVPGTSDAVMSAALRLLFSDPAVQRVIVEPDARNDRVRALNRRAGFRELAQCELPEKTACLSVLERHDTAAQDTAAASDRPQEVLA